MALVLPAGTKFELEGTEWEVIRGRGSTVTARKATDASQEQTFNLADLVQYLKSDALKIISVGSADEGRPGLVLLSELPEKVRKMVAWRYRVVTAIEAGDHSILGYRETLASLAAEYGQTPAGDKRFIGMPALRTAQEWLTLFRNSDGDVMTLVPTFKRKAGPRYDPRLVDIVESKIDGFFMTKRRPHITEVMAAVHLEVEEHNKTAGDNPIAVPAQAVLYKRTWRAVAARSPRAIMLAREGRRAMELVYGPVGDAPRPTRILELVEMDHTDINRELCDEGGAKLGKPTLTYCTDKCTGCTLGLYIGFERHSAWAVLQCLRNAILPKDYIKTDYPGIGEWNAQGLPETLVVDNGNEMKGNDLAEACRQLKITLRFTRTYRGQDKGSVERFFGTLKAKFEQGPDAPPIPYYEFAEYVYRALVDEYLHTPNRGVGGPPAALWDEQFNQARDAICSRYDRETVIVALSPIATRVPSKHGIEWNYLFYNSDALQELRSRNLGSRLTMRYDPDNLGHIWVTEPESGAQLRVPCTRPGYAEGLSLRAHQFNKRLAKNKEGKPNYVTLYTAEQKRESMTQQAIGSEKVRKKLGMTSLDISQGKDLSKLGPGFTDKTATRDEQRPPSTPKLLDIKLRPREQSEVGVRVGRHQLGKGKR